MIDHEAVYNTHKNVTSIINEVCYDKDGYQVVLNEILVKQEINRLTVERNKTEYRRLRAKEYPPVTDYLDAVVKGDLVQQQAYIDACLAVKAKYPKPEGL
jgi:hypothetical protein